MTIISLVLVHVSSMDSRRWPARYIRRRSNNDFSRKGAKTQRKERSLRFTWRLCARSFDTGISRQGPNDDRSAFKSNCIAAQPRHVAQDGSLVRSAGARVIACGDLVVARWK